MSGVWTVVSVLGGHLLSLSTRPPLFDKRQYLCPELQHLGIISEKNPVLAFCQQTPQAWLCSPSLKWNLHHCWIVKWPIYILNNWENYIPSLANKLLDYLTNKFLMKWLVTSGFCETGDGNIALAARSFLLKYLP